MLANFNYAYKPEHSLGLKGHFHLPVSLQKIARDHGIILTHIGNDRIRLDRENSPLNVAALMPGSFQTDDKNLFPVLNFSQLKSFLEFLRQPVKISVRAVSNAPEKWHKKDSIAAQYDDERKTIQRVLRFATIGSVDLDHEIRPASLAHDHSEIEGKIHAGDAWNTEAEIGVNAGIPGSAIDFQKGFIFQLGPKMTAADGFTGESQQELKNRFWEIIDQVTHDRFTERPENIHLTGSEFENFCRIVQKDHDAFSALAYDVRVETRFDARMDQIERRIENLARSHVFQNLSGAQGAEAARQRIDILLEATSALTPILGSQSMRDLRKRYQYGRYKDSSIKDLLEEYAAFAALLQKQKERPDLSPATVEAITQEFYPLLTFSEKLARIMADGYGQKKILRRHGGWALDTSAYFSSLAAVFRDSSAADISLKNELMDDRYWDILSVLEKSAGLKGITFSELAKMAGRTVKEFTGDISHFVKARPVLAAAVFIGVAALLYSINPGNPEANAHALFMPLENGGYGKIVLDSHSWNSLPAEATQRVMWHPDMGLLGPYKHFIYDNVVKASAQAALDATRDLLQTVYVKLGLPVNHDPAFIDAGNSVIDGISTNFFRIDAFQNASHAAFWEGMIVKGFYNGLRGWKTVFGFLKPPFEILYQVVHRTKDLTGLGRYPSVSARLMALTHDLRETKNISLAAAINFSDLAEAARERISFETARLTMNIGPVKFAGLEKTFEVNAQNWNAIQRALDQFDLTLQFIADKIGIDQPWYQQFLNEKLNNTRRALHYYSIGNAPDKLEILQKTLDENLEDLMAAQIRYGSSALYEAFHGAQPDKKNGWEIRGPGKNAVWHPQAG